VKCHLCNRDYDVRRIRFVERRDLSRDRRTRKFILVEVAYHVRLKHFCSQKCMRRWQLGWVPLACFNCRQTIPNKVCRSRESWLRKEVFCARGCAAVYRLRKLRVHPDDYSYMRNSWSPQNRRVKERDNYTCQVCGKTRERARLAVDHIVPFRLSQLNAMENLITLCTDCHRLKSKLEERLFLGRVGNFLSGLRRAGWSMATVKAAMTLYGLPVNERARPLPRYWGQVRWHRA
jgi:5-methylcytosine-specific restriction endonuclease McrA